MIAEWEIERGRSFFLRAVCAKCHLISAEHEDPWMNCNGRWIDLANEQRLRGDRPAPK